jgi:hypothetical protein
MTIEQALAAWGAYDRNDPSPVYLAAPSPQARVLKPRATATSWPYPGRTTKNGEVQPLGGQIHGATTQFQPVPSRPRGRL